METAACRLSANDLLILSLERCRAWKDRARGIEARQLKIRSERDINAYTLLTPISRSGLRLKVIS